MKLYKSDAKAGLLHINLLTLLDRRSIKENGLHASVWLLTLFICRYLASGQVYLYSYNLLRTLYETTLLFIITKFQISRECPQRS